MKDKNQNTETQDSGGAPRNGPASGSPFVWVGLSKVNGCVVCVEIELPANYKDWQGIVWVKFVPANSGIY